MRQKRPNLFTYYNYLYQLPTELIHGLQDRFSDLFFSSFYAARR